MVASKIIALCALLAAAVSAQQEVDLNERVAVEEFWKRDAPAQYQAHEQIKAGSSCDVAFGDGYVTCREKSASKIRLCYNPAIGQVCCQNSWGCPSGSYCLASNLCCPSGVDPAVCAGSSSAVSASQLITADSGPAPSSVAPPSAYITYTSTLATSTPIVTLSPNPPDSVTAAGYDTALAVVTSSIDVVPMPIYAAGNSSASYYPTDTGIAPSYTPVKSAVTSTPAQFTGAASSNLQFSTVGGIAALLAIAGLL